MHKRKLGRVIGGRHEKKKWKSSKQEYVIGHGGIDSWRRVA